MKGIKQSEQKVFVILGPTSTGKTSLALKLCKKFNGEIISADSRQVVKYMDIGTGKIPTKLNNVIPGLTRNPSPASSQAKVRDLALHFVQDKLRVPPVIPSITRNLARHPYILDEVSIWGYDLINPNEYFSGYDYANFALNKSQQILEQDKTVFLVGGTGFYIDLVTKKIKPALIEPNVELRKELGEMSLIQLQTILRKLNSEKFGKIDQDNPARLIRAIEIAKNSITHHSDPLPYLKNVNFVHVGLNAPREILYKNADSWLDSIWKYGLEEEVSSLLKGPYSQSPKLKGLVYGETTAYLKGTFSKKEAIQRSKFALHAYIRRQLTWFKKNANITWFDITQDNFEQNIYNFVNG